MLNKILKYTLISIGFLSLGTGAFLGLRYAQGKQAETKCIRINIEIQKDGQDTYLQGEDIVQYLKARQSYPLGKNKGRINTAFVENILAENPFIKEAQVYMALDSVLSIYVKQRTPALKVQNERGAFFALDEEGFMMPVNESYPIRTRIVLGSVHQRYIQNTKVSRGDSSKSHTMLANLLHLSKCIAQHKLLDEQIDQIYVSSTGEIELIPLIGPQNIIFGDFQDMDEKLERIQNMYEYAFPKLGWDKYKTISVKYKNQVVCTKI